MSNVVSYKDSQGLIEYKLNKRATRKLINRAKNDSTFNNAKTKLMSFERTLDKLSSNYSDDSNMTAGEYYSDDIAQAMDDTSDIMGNLSNYAEKHYSHNNRAMYSGFDNTQRALDLWNAVSDTWNDYDCINTVDDTQDLLKDCGDIGNASQRHAMDKLDNMDSGAYCQDFGDGDIEYLDPDDACDFINDMVNTIRNYQKGKNDIY